MIGTLVLYKPFVRLGVPKQIHYLHLLEKCPYHFGICILLVACQLAESFMKKWYQTLTNTSPHQFSHQFGFHQDTPGYLENDICVESLAEGLRYWRIFNHRSHEKFLEDNLEVLVEKSKSNHVKTPLSPQHQSKKLNSSKASKKEVVHTSTDKRNVPKFFSLVNEPSKRQAKTTMIDVGRTKEVQSIGSPSRTLTIQSEKVTTIAHLMGSQRESPQVSDESTALSRPNTKSTSNTEQKQKTLFTSCNQTLKGLTPNSN
ncbi:hypothetical protein H5410_057152 [Solanum commersonii]|uniref:Uncharacterized protein n=1 Tax=Solanum commersonii TaxID=4109 RepID=A0A9J5WN96_SOLCO|nr:hypothetical protein H5410_057152 [Solanum commersonii]